MCLVIPSEARNLALVFVLRLTRSRPRLLAPLGMTRLFSISLSVACGPRLLLLFPFLQFLMQILDLLLELLQPTLLVCGQRQKVVRQ